jgi:hypothetical protein
MDRTTEQFGHRLTAHTRAYTASTARGMQMDQSRSDRNFAADQ